MASFSDIAKQRLATYKQDVLGVAEDGLWRKGQAYPHILPSDRKELNILPPYREEFWQKATADKIKLHTDFHHLNSSQAAAFNLFFPALVESATTQCALVNALVGKEGAIDQWTFEAIPDSDEGTNFDLFIQLQTGGKIYVEVKFTELSFGAANPDDAHRTKLEGLYRQRLTDLVTAGFLEEASFFPNYQLLRNISYCVPGRDSVIFVVPAGNTAVRNHADVVLSGALKPGSDGVVVVTIEQIVTTLSSIDGQPQRWYDHYRMFQEKYLWDSQSA